MNIFTVVEIIIPFRNVFHIVVAKKFKYDTHKSSHGGDWIIKVRFECHVISIFFALHSWFTIDDDQRLMHLMRAFSRAFWGEGQDAWMCCRKKFGFVFFSKLDQFPSNWHYKLFPLPVVSIFRQPVHTAPSRQPSRSIF